MDMNQKKEEKKKTQKKQTWLCQGETEQQNYKHNKT